MLRLPVLLFVLVAIFGSALAAPDIPKEPVLRIETGAHLSPITRISSDAAGNWAVTSSEDKTARIWSVATGQLEGVLRVPQDEGQEGSAFKVPSPCAAEASGPRRSGYGRDHGCA